MKIPIYSWSQREQKVHAIHVPSASAFVPRIIKPLRLPSYTIEFDSSVDLDHRELRNCVTKHYIGNNTWTYTHRITK